jgi:hypothetical protein
MWLLEEEDCFIFLNGKLEKTICMTAIVDWLGRFPSSSNGRNNFLCSSKCPTIGPHTLIVKSWARAEV